MSRERWLLVGSVAIWLTIAVFTLIASTPLGHDEAQYAVAARADTSPWLYLSPGCVALARVGVWLGGDAWLLRLVPTLLGAGIVLATFLVGSIAFGGPIGAWAAAVIAGAHSLVLHNAELLSDLPAAVCLLAAIVILVAELETTRLTWRLVLVAPAFAAAFYLRYGSAPVIAIIVLAAVAFYARRLLAQPVIVLATAVLFVALLVPHALHSLRTTGSVLGVLELSATAPARSYVGEGLVTYLTANPLRFYGFLAAPCMLIGIVGALYPPRRSALFLVSIALGQIAALGLQTRAQPRYVCVAIVLLVVLGVDALARWVARAPRPTSVPASAKRAAFAAMPLVVLAWIGTSIAAVAIARHLARARAPLEAAAAAIRADDAGQPCVIVSRQMPQLMWHTGCEDNRSTALHPRRYLVALPGETPEVPPDATPVPLPAPARVWRYGP